MLSVRSSSFEEGIENHTLPQGLREKGRKCNCECPRTSLQHGDSEKEGGNYRVDMELKVPSFFERECLKYHALATLGLLDNTYPAAAASLVSKLTMPA